MPRVSEPDAVSQKHTGHASGAESNLPNPSSRMQGDQVLNIDYDNNRKSNKQIFAKLIKFIMTFMISVVLEECKNYLAAQSKKFKQSLQEYQRHKEIPIKTKQHE